jgi:hypothetical protein
VTRLLLILVTVLTAGCPAPKSSRALTPVLDAGQRLQFRGFSVLPPQGPDWYADRWGSDGTVFYKPRSAVGVPIKGAAGPGREAQVFYAAAFGGRLEGASLDSLDTLRELAEQPLLSRGRFRLLSGQTVPDTSLGADCVRYDAVHEERGNPRAPSLVLTLTVHGFVCRHPAARDFVVHLLYSERYAQGDEPRPTLTEALQSEVEPFLRSLRFEPL